MSGSFHEMGRSDSEVASLQAAKGGYTRLETSEAEGEKEGEASSPRKEASGEWVFHSRTLDRSVQPGNPLSPSTLLLALV